RRSKTTTTSSTCGRTSTSRRRADFRNAGWGTGDSNRFHCRVPRSESRVPPVKVLGFDPGTTATGYGVVLFELGRLRLEGCGVLRPPAALDLPKRLDFLFTSATRVLEECRPAAVSVETVFAARNIASTVKLAQARGVLLAAAARCGVP